MGTDDQCNLNTTGICQPGVEDEKNCNFCDNGCCRPGCKFDAGSTGIPRCASEQPHCNLESHQCDLRPGSILLYKIVVKTKDCINCNASDEGIHLVLTGNDVFLLN